MYNKKVLYFVRLLVALLFIFSGFTKCVDPIGFSYKLDEYFSHDVLNLVFLMPTTLFLAIFISSFEIVLGFFLIFGYRIKISSYASFLMILFFTFLTFYSAYFDKVQDCGCFGDAIKLSPWQSFYKDVVLLFLTGYILFYRNKIKCIIPENRFRVYLILLSFIVPFSFTFYNYYNLPIKDFRPYKIGNDINKELISIPDEVKYQYKLKNKLSGDIVLFDNFPEDYQNDWIYEGYENIILKKGKESKIKDFSIVCNNLESISYEEDKTYDFLNYERLLLVVMYDVEKSNNKFINDIKNLYFQSLKLDIPLFFLSGSSDEINNKYKETHSIQCEFCFSDATVLKTMIRSNPGVMYIEKGVVVDKFHIRSLNKIKLN